MDEFVAEPRIALRIEHRPQPIDEMRHATDAPGIRMIGHPDVDLMAKVDVERDEVGADCSDIGRQWTDANSELYRPGKSCTDVGAQCHDAFNAGQIEGASQRILAT